MNSHVELELPPRLLQKIRGLIEGGWFEDFGDFFETAGRYYLERHTDEMWEHYVQHEIRAGLYEEY
jgi:hypothetical protein